MAHNRNKVAIVGLGVNNRPLLPFLMKNGSDVIIADRRSEELVWSEIATWDLPKVPTLVTGSDYLEQLAQIEDIDIAYLTPGMVKTVNPIQQMRHNGTVVTCETDLFFQICPAPVIGITGSAGKTTTTSLVGDALLRDGRKKVFVGGNIGRSLLSEIDAIADSDWVIMELSSFQLELVEHSPHGAAVLNLSPNHLDIHGSFEAYRQAKQQILRYQKEDDWAVLPFGDRNVEPMWGHHKGRRIFFSMEANIPRGAFLEKEQLWWRTEDEQRAVIALDELQLLGRHNVANALAAIAIVGTAGGSLDAMAETLRNFTGVSHRLERVAEQNGVVFIDDSIATSPDRARAALEAIPTPIILIAGGYDKQIPFDALGQAVAKSSVRSVVVLGQTAEKIRDAIRQYSTVPIQWAESFDQAVEQARRLAKPGDTVLLSPAAASYDMFRNYEERGQRFRDLVRE